MPTPMPVRDSAVDGETVRNRFFLWTMGITVSSNRRPAVHSGGGNRIGHSSVCTWLTRQMAGFLDHRGTRKGIPLQTSTMRSTSRKFRR